MTTTLDDELSAAPPATLDVPVCRALDQSIALRADGDPEGGDDGTIGRMVGHFSVFDSWYEINSWFEGHFLERIAPGAFKRTIKNRSGESPIRVLLEHGFDPTVGDKPLGIPDVLEERDGGGYAETPLFDTSYNRDLVPALRGGAYGQSFRFQVLRDEWVEEPEVSDANPRGIPERTIKEVRLIEFGPTVFPASPATNSSTGLRSTTDQFYEQLKRRDPAAFDSAVARSQALRLPQAPDGAPQTPADAPSAAGQPEDPPTRHSEDPPAPEATHSEDSQGQHSATASPAHPVPERTSTMETNMTIEERAARQSEIRARLAEIDDQFAGGELDQESRTEWDELETEFDTHTRAIEDAQRRREALAARAADNPSATEPVRPGRAPSAPARRPENIYDLAEIRQQARSLDELPSLLRDNAMRAVEQARFPGVDSKEAAQERAARLLDTVDDGEGTLARRFLATGSPTYARAFGKVLAGAALTAEEQRALALSPTSDGGYAVPFQLDPTVILTSDGVADPLRQVARVEQIVGEEWRGVTSAGVSVGRSGEATEADDDSFDLGQPTVKATRVDAFVPFSLEIEADWARMQTEITRVLADAKAAEEADAFINGNGTPPNPQGLLTGTTQNVGPASAGAFSEADLYNLEEALPERWAGNATFLAHRSFYNAVRQLGADSDGGNLWVRLADGLPPELIGYSARRHSEMPAFNTGAVDGTVLAVFGDFRQFLIVDRIGMSVELVPHLIGANRRPTGQRGIFAYWRNASKVLVDGAFRRLVTDDGVA